MKHNKAVIETLINSLALSMTSLGMVILSTQEDGWALLSKGLILILFGVGLEWFKYWGRQKKLW